MLLCFILQNLERVKGKFLLSASVVEVRNIRSLHDVFQIQRQGFLRGQMRGTTAQHAAQVPHNKLSITSEY